MVRRVITEYMPDFAGDVIDEGRLQLLDSLGSGAYGKVYLAVDRTSSKAKRKYYAVKCLCKLTPGCSQDQFQKRELVIQSMVHHHPNIVTLHKVVYDRFFIYVVLDFCAGGDLFTALTERKLFERNDELIKWVFVQLIDAVQYCHQQGVSHRDIKPENILVSEDGTRIFLADFGLSTWDDFSTEFGFGSSHYMSPGMFLSWISSFLRRLNHNRVHWKGFLRGSSVFNTDK
jgi:serine/threonine protein kinase